MLLQEKFERMDWVSYGNDREREGIIEGEQKGEIKGFIKLYNAELKLTPTVIVSKIMKHFDLSKEEADNYVKETLGLQ